MRLLEVVLILLIAIVAFWAALRSGRSWLVLGGAGAVLVLAAVQLGVEGYRWQMLPAYVAAAALAIGSGAVMMERTPRALHGRRARVALLVAGGGVVAGAVALPLLLPVPRLPEPTGPYAVGTVTYQWTDRARTDPLALAPGSPRELMVQLWYPAEPSPALPRARYIDHPAVARATARAFGLPAFTFDHLRLVRTHARVDAPVAAGEARYPVLLFSHGLGGGRGQSTALAEELASWGYVVASVDHTHEAGAVAFPDDRIVRASVEVPPGVTEEEDRIKAGWVSLRAADLRFVADELARLDAAAGGGRFTGRLDLARLGIFGHSLGGATALEALRLDERFKAGVALDSTLRGETVGARFDRPLLFMTGGKGHWESEADRTRYEDRLRQVSDNLRASGYRLTLDGAGHANFGDFPLFTRLPLHRVMNSVGPIGGRRGTRVVAAYTRAFFDQHLRGRRAILLDGPSPRYPEVRFDAIQEQEESR